MQPQIKFEKVPKNSAYNDASLDLETLEYHHEFVDRHIGPSDDQIGSMLSEIGIGSLEALVEKTVPASILSANPLALPDPTTENAALEKLKAIAEKNQPTRSFIGLGYYDTYTPNVMLRNVL